MRYLKGLSQETLSVLERIYKQSKYYQVRQRAHCLRLSYQGYQISELMKIFQVSRNTIYNWFENVDSYESYSNLVKAVENISGCGNRSRDRDGR
jgi:hypothetical protein